MLHETRVVGSDDWWAFRLATKLGQDFPRLGQLKAHYEGTVEVPDGGGEQAREAYRRFLGLGRLNMARL